MRRFGQDGATYALEPFQGTPEQWLEQLDRVVSGVAVPRSDEDSLKFREAYLNRVKRISAGSPLPCSRRITPMCTYSLRTASAT